MGQPRIRVYYGPEESASATLQNTSPDANCVTVPLSEISALLAHAVVRRKAWLQDFADDQVTISSDLYDILMAYDRYHREG